MGQPGSDYSIIEEKFDSLASFWLKPQTFLNWDSIFILPPWLEVWRNAYGSTADPCLYSVHRNGTVIGLAPLLLKEDEASLIGSDDVCDFVDFVVVPGEGDHFFNVLIDHLKKKGIRRLNLGLLRPDSTVFNNLISLTEERNIEVSCAAEDVSLEMDLPDSWEGYLGMLKGKQRHEVRRKLKRFREKGRSAYRVIEEQTEVPEAMDLFLTFFRQSRKDKESFLTPKREAFFRAIAERMAQEHLFRLGILDLDDKPVAAILYFEYNDVVYLYNSGYDPHYGSMGVGLISKILCIKDCTEKGMKKFDFLKGAEVYKYRLGGKEVPLHRCLIDI
jgi:CelD/BcsL family acetyltransferase involved in cellulose biosynthesis